VALPVLFGFWLPLAALVVFLGGLALAVVALDHIVALAFLAVGIALLLLLFLGRFVVLLFRPGAADEPRRTATVRAHTITGRDKVPLYVDSVGPREQFSIILCHGWGLTSDVWYYLKKSRRLERLGRITTWDLRGSGRSGRPTSGNYDLGAMARDLRDVIESEGARRIVLAGQGLGGLVVLEYCRQFSEQLGRRVAGLLLVGTPRRVLDAPSPLLRLAAALSPLVVLLQRLVYLSGLGHLVAAMAAFGGRESRGQLDLVTRSIVAVPPRVALRSAAAMAGFDPRPVLAGLSVPVLLVAGAEERRDALPQQQPEGVETPATTSVVLPHSGALSFLERSGEFEQRLRDWLETLPDGPGGRRAQRRREQEAAAESE